MKTFSKLGLSLAAVTLLSLNATEPASADIKIGTMPAISSNTVSQRTIANRPDFGAHIPANKTINKNAVKNVSFSLAPAYNTPIAAAPQASSITIMGTAEATPEQMLRYIRRRNPSPKLTGTLEELVTAYYEEAGREGIRPDIALCQALKETGFFAYGGDVAPEQNNFCGLGATGNHEPGHSFPDIRTGVRAHIQHLLVYTSKKMPKSAIVDPRYDLVKQNRPDVYGSVTHWIGLNGVWAVPGKQYGEDIIRLWQAGKAPDGSDIDLKAADKQVAERGTAADLIYRGAVYYQRGSYENALADFNAARILDANISEAQYNLALTYAALGDTKQAQNTYESYLKQNPKATEAYYNLGLLYLDGGNQKSALAAFQKAVEHAPEHADAQNAIGVVNISQQKYAEAWASFYKASQLNYANMNVLANQFILEACLTDNTKNKKDTKKKSR